MSDGLILSTAADDAALGDAAQELAWALPDEGEPGSLYESDGSTINVETVAYIYAAARRDGLSEKHASWLCGYAGAEGLKEDRWKIIRAKAATITDPWGWLDAHTGDENVVKVKSLLGRYEGAVAEFKPATIDLSGAPKPPLWVIEGDAACKRATAISGDQSASKTTLLLRRALAVARGEEFMGRATKRGRVLIVTGEEDLEQIQEEKLKPLDFAAADLGQIDLYTRGTFPLIGTEEGDRWLIDTAEAGGYVLVCVDTTSSAVGGIDGNSNDQVNALFTGTLEPLLDRTGAALIFNHHERKSGGTGDRSTAAMGARAWTNRPSFHLTLATVGKYAEKATGKGDHVATARKFVERRPKVRGGAEDEPFVYELVGEKDRPNGATLRLEPALPHTTFTDAELLVVACDGEKSRKGLAEALGWNATGTRFDKALSEALDQKLVRKVERGVYAPGEATE
jgi:hypothetical protein